METAQSMMAYAGLPDKYWAEAVDTAAYIRNRTSTSSIKGNKTPCQPIHWTFKSVQLCSLCPHT